MTSHIKRAAESLRHEAAAIADCHTLDGKDWTGEDDARAAHDEMLSVAAALEAEHAVRAGIRLPDISSQPYRATVGRVQKLGRIDDHHLVVQGVTTVADCGVAGKAFSPQHKAWSIAIASLLNIAHPIPISDCRS